MTNIERAYEILEKYYIGALTPEEVMDPADISYDDFEQDQRYLSEWEDLTEITMDEWKAAFVEIRDAVAEYREMDSYQARKVRECIAAYDQ